MEKIIEKRFATVQLRDMEADSENRYVEGYAATFNVWGDGGWFREQILPGAFRTALDKSDPRALFNHKEDLLLGRKSSGTLELSEDSTGLSIRFLMPKYATNIQEMMDRGDLNQMSFAFTVLRDEWRWGADYEKEERDILEVDTLHDVSLVTFPFYEESKAYLRNSDVARQRLEQLRKAADTGMTEEQRRKLLDAKMSVRRNHFIINQSSF